jgi:hypothetical protein
MPAILGTKPPGIYGQIQFAFEPSPTVTQAPADTIIAARRPAKFN